MLKCGLQSNDRGHSDAHVGAWTLFGIPVEMPLRNSRLLHFKMNAHKLELGRLIQLVDGIDHAAKGVDKVADFLVFTGNDTTQLPYNLAWFDGAVVQK